MGISLYTDKKTYVNGSTPAINATNLNSTEEQIDKITKYLNAEYSTETTATAEITSLPSSDIENGELELTLRGNSVSNILEDDVAGCESTSGWTGTATIALDSSNELEGTNCLKLTLNSTANQYRYYNAFSSIDTSKYYLITGYVKNEDLSGDGIKMLVGVSTTAELSTSFITDTAYTRVGIVVDPTYLTSTTYFRIYASIDGTSGEYGFIDAIQINEITSAEYALGADALLSSYPFHRGLQGTEPCETSCVGKNLNSGSLEFGYYNSTTGAKVNNLNFLRSATKIKLEPSTTYKIKESGSYTFDVQEWNEQGSFLSQLGANITQFTTSSKGAYVTYNTNSSGQNDLTIELQLEKGSSATTYEPFAKTTVKTPNRTYHSVPNTYDYFNFADGVDYKACEEYELVSGDITSINTSGTNVDRVVCSIPSNAKIGTAGANGQTVPKGFESEVASTSIDLISSVGKHFYGTTTTNLQLIVAKGAYATLGDAQTALAGTKIIYQLATPITTKYPPQNLISKPSGTIFNEFHKTQTTPYTASGIIVSDTNFPIANLIEVTKVNLTTKEETTIDIADCTIAAGGLSYTCTELSANDTVRTKYSYEFLSTRGEIAYSYPTNSMGENESNTKMIGQLGKEVDKVQNELDTAVKEVGATQGDILYSDVDNSIANLAKGTAFQHLGMNASATAPQWQESANSVLTTQGDMLYADGANSLARLAKGTAYQSLRMNSGATAPEWGSPVATGVFSDTSTVISTESTYTKDIALGFTPTFGVLMIHSSRGGSSGAIIYFGSTSSDSVAMSNIKSGSTLFKAYNGNTQLSDELWGGTDNIYIQSVRIDGTDLEIVFYNTNDDDDTLTIDKARWAVW